MNDFEKLKQEIMYDLIIFCMLPKNIFNMDRRRNNEN